MERALLQSVDVHSAPAWLAMRDWGLDGDQAAKACAWAIRALLNDLKQRGNAPLDETT